MQPQIFLRSAAYKVYFLTISSPALNKNTLAQKFEEAEFHNIPALIPYELHKLAPLPPTCSPEAPLTTLPGHSADHQYMTIEEWLKRFDRPNFTWWGILQYSFKKTIVSNISVQKSTLSCCNVPLVKAKQLANYESVSFSVHRVSKIKVSGRKNISVYKVWEYSLLFPSER